MIGEKSKGFAFLVNFLIPGAGHVYASEGTKGLGIVLVGVLCSLGGYGFPLLWIGSLGAWIFALVTTSDVVDECNRQRQISRREELDAMAPPVRRTDELSDRQKADAERERAEERQRKEDAKRNVTGSEVAAEFRKLANLQRLGVIDSDELLDQRLTYIGKLQQRTTNESLADFFMPIGDLDEKDRPDKDEMENLKRVHKRITSA